MITAIILAGGLGTRLAPLFPEIPKPLVPIHGKPFLHLLLEKLETSGMISKVILALGHKADLIQRSVTERKGACPVEYSVEESLLGTGGALLLALLRAESETVLVLNGDSYFDISLGAFLQEHQRKKADISIACRKVEDVRRYGLIEMDLSGRITAFHEKQEKEKAGWINAGMYLINRNLFLSFPTQTCSLEKELFPLCLSRQMMAYCGQGTFVDIGIPQAYFAAQQLLTPWATR